MKKNSLEIITLKKRTISDFAGERNRLLNARDSDWVFFLDSDEKISPGLIKEIDRTLKNPVKGKNAYYIVRRNYFLGRYVGSDRIIRLGRRRAGEWRRIVHETWNIDGAIGELKNPLIHNTAANLKEYIQKINYYSDLHAIANNKEGKRASLFKIIFYPALKFVFTLIKSKNVVFSIMQSLHSFLSWSKLYFLSF